MLMLPCINLEKIISLLIRNINLIHLKKPHTRVALRNFIRKLQNKGYSSSNKSEGINICLLSQVISASVLFTTNTLILHCLSKVASRFILTIQLDF